MKQTLCYVHRNAVINYVIMNDVSVVNDFKIFEVASAEIKIAVIDLTEYADSLTDFEQMLYTVSSLNSNGQNIHIVVRFSDLVDRLYNKIIRHDLAHITYVINGVINHRLTHSNVCTQLGWFQRVKELYYNSKPELLVEHNKLSTSKEYLFEVTYGQRRYHREYIHEKVSNSIYCDNILQSKFFSKSGMQSTTMELNSLNEWEDEIKFIDDEYLIDYFGHRMLGTELIPFKIYNQSLYSIVCESAYSNNYSFFSEKISKPIMTKRLFIVISGQHYLKNLRSLGFKTFNGIIDESYDDEPNNEKRWDMAFRQVELICSQDQNIILAKCKSICDYNSNIIQEISSTVVEDLINSQPWVNSFN